MHAEAELVLCAVQCELGTEQADDTLASLLQANLDWKAVANLATRNGVLPLVYRRLSTVAAARTLPPLPEQLKTLFHVNAIRSHHLTAELLRLLKLLESHEVAAIPFKGPALAVLLHGDVTMRQFVDLDLFVRRSDVIRAAELLGGAGYRSAFDCGEALGSNFFDAYQSQFISLERRAHVDLHWAVTPNSLPFGPSLERLWTRAQRAYLNGTLVQTLAALDLLHVLCLHGCRDGWDQLSSVVSVAGLVELMHSERDWALLIDEAREYRSYRMVLLGLCLADRWLKTPLPPDIARVVNADRAIASLARKIGAGFFIYSNAGRNIQQRAQQVLVPLKVIESRRDRVRYWVARALRPTHLEGAFVRLPKPLFPLYYVLRPARLLLKLVVEPVKRLRRWGRSGGSRLDL